MKYKIASKAVDGSLPTNGHWVYTHNNNGRSHSAHQSCRFEQVRQAPPSNSKTYLPPLPWETCSSTKLVFHLETSRTWAKVFNSLRTCYTVIISLTLFTKTNSRVKARLPHFLVWNNNLGALVFISAYITKMKLSLLTFGLLFAIIEVGFDSIMKGRF